MVCYGYLRVSTGKQMIDNMKAEILLLANSKQLGNVLFIQETVSGRVDWKKRVLGKEFEKMKDGDVLLMSEYSRIGRSFLQSLEFLSECKRKGVKVYSTIGDIPLNDDANANLMLAVTAWKAQVERETLAYRTKIGIQEAKNRGSVLGRKKMMILDKDPNSVNRIQGMLNKDMRLRTIAKENKCTYPTLKKFIKKHNLKIEITDD